MPQTPTTWLDRTQVNPATTGFQGQQQIVGLSNGNILVVFADDSATSPSGGRDVTAVIYDAVGNVVRPAFELNFNFFNDSEENPSIAATNDGGFILVYEDDDVGGTSLRAERFDSAGEYANGTSVFVDAGAIAVGTPKVAVDLTDNSFFVTYEHHDGNNDTIRGRKFDSGMNAVGNEVILRTDEDLTNTTPSGDPRQPDTAALEGGGFVTVFGEDDPNAGATDPGIEFRLSNAAGGNGNNLTVTDLNGLSESQPRVAALFGGGFVVTWMEYELTGSNLNNNIKYRVYESNGTARTGVMTAADSDNNHSNADVIGLEDGTFFIAWGDSTANRIEGQLYSGATGVPIGDERYVEINGNPGNPTLGTTTDGRILVTYQTTDGGNDVHFEIFDSRSGLIIADPGDGQITARPEGSSIEGSSVSERLIGQDGNDTFQYAQDSTSASNADTILGGGGIDTFHITTLLDERLVDLNAGIFAFANIEMPVVEANDIRGYLYDIENVSVAGAQDVRGNSTANLIAATGVFDNDFEGLGGADTFVTGGGIDRLIFNNAAEIGNGLGTRDVISDFTQGFDLIDLDDFDALTTVAGVQHFTFLGMGAHTGAGATLRYTQSGGNTLLYGDVDANGSADFTLQFNGLFDLTAADFTDLSIAAVQGSSLADFVSGTHGSEAVIGVDGNDTLVGLDGNDTMRGGNGADTMTGGGDLDRYDFNSVAEIGNAVNARDVITDFQQWVDVIDLDGIDANTVSAGVQHFTWLGTASHTGAGATLRYQQSGGNTLVYGDVDANGTGDFTIQINGLVNLTASDFTVGSISRINGTDGDDFLLGMAGGKLMSGFDGNDTINGGAGADTLQGGAGFDQMSGSLGADVFDFNAIAHIGLNAGSRDIVAGFQQGVDKIDLSDIDANTTIAGNQAFSFIGADPHTGAGATLRAVQSGGNTLVYGDVDANGTGDFALQLTGLFTLTAADFVL